MSANAIQPDDLVRDRGWRRKSMTRILTEEDARAELEPLFQALAMAHIAYSAVILRSTGRRPTTEMAFGEKLRTAERQARRYELYHERYFGPLTTKGL